MNRREMCWNIAVSPFSILLGTGWQENIPIEWQELFSIITSVRMAMPGELPEGAYAGLLVRPEGYHVLLTADHGNAEEMCEELEDGGHRLHTQHTLNPVPALWISPGTAIAPKSARKPLHDGTLEDVMPTLLDMMKLPIPPEVTGKSLI
jgi:hypothetical protein